jgi:hypothetical protein
LDARLARAFYAHLPAQLAGEAFASIDWNNVYNPITRSDALPAQPDKLVKGKRWVAAASEAMACNDPARLAKLARYSQKSVRRTVAGNHHIDDATFIYLATWATSNCDEETIRALLVTHHPRRLLLVSDDTLAILLERRGDYSSFYLDGWFPRLLSLPREEVLDLLVAMVAGKHPGTLSGPVARHRIARAYARGVQTPCIAIDELFELALGTAATGEKRVAEELSATTHYTPGMARMIAANPVPHRGRWSYGPPAEFLSVVLEEGRLDGNSFGALVLVADELTEQAYERVVSGLEDLGDEGLEWLAQLLSSGSGKLHVHKMTPAQQQRLALLTMRTKRSCGPDLRGHAAELTWMELDEELVCSLLAASSEEARRRWLITTLRNTRRPTPAMVRSAACERVAEFAHSWLPYLIPELLTAEDDALIDAAFEVAGKVDSTMWNTDGVVRGVCRVFDRRFGESAEHWSTALGLLPDWDGSLDELISTTLMFLGAPQSAVEEPDESVEVRDDNGQFLLPL